jgi:hypothetical protein
MYFRVYNAVLIKVLLPRKWIALSEGSARREWPWLCNEGKPFGRNCQTCIARGPNMNIATKLIRRTKYIFKTKIHIIQEIQYSRNLLRSTFE